MGRFVALILLITVIFMTVTYLLYRMFLAWRWIVLIPSMAAWALGFYYLIRSLRPQEGLLDIAYRLMAILFFFGGLGGLSTGLWLKIRKVPYKKGRH